MSQKPTDSKYTCIYSPEDGASRPQRRRRAESPFAHLVQTAGQLIYTLVEDNYVGLVTLSQPQTSGVSGREAD